MRVVLDVTQECIDRAREILRSRDHSRAMNCPIAQAAKNVVDERYFVSVGPLRLRIGTTTTEFALVNAEFLEFMDSFDRDRYVEPRTFEVDIPAQYLKMRVPTDVVEKELV